MKTKYTHVIKMNKDGFCLMDIKGMNERYFDTFTELLLCLEDVSTRTSIQAYVCGMTLWYKHMIKTMLTSGYEQNKGKIDTKVFEELEGEPEYPLFLFDYLIIGNGSDCLYFDIYTWRNKNHKKGKDKYVNKRIYMKNMDKYIVSDSEDMTCKEILNEILYIKSLGIEGGTISAMAKNEIKAAVGEQMGGKKKAGFRAKDKAYEILYGHDGDLLTEEEFDCMTLAYPSPFHMIDKKCRDGKDIKGGIHIDTNSRFPYMMKCRPMPYGMPIPFDGQPEYIEESPLWIAKVAIVARLKKGHLPCYSEMKGNLTSKVQYMDKIYCEFEGHKAPFSIVVSSVEFELLKEHYDFLTEPIWEGGWYFKTTYNVRLGINMGLANFVDKWFKLKTESKAEGNKILNKLSKSILNTCYGGFGKKKGYDSIYFDLHDYYGETKFEMERYKKDSENVGFGEYLPVAIFIVAWSNLEIVRDIHKDVKKFVYCNIDSIVWNRKDVPEGIEIDGDKLGAYKLENIFELGRFMNIGCYMEDSLATISGLSKSVSSSITDIENFYHGAVYENPVIFGTDNGVKEVIQEFRIESCLN